MAIPAEFSDLKGAVDDLAGLDVTDTERDRLINEGHIELCVRSGFSKATLNLGPTVAGQAEYTIPATVRKILHLAVNGRPYAPTDDQAMLNQTLGYIESRSDGHWWISYSAAAVRQLSIEPTTEAGNAISALCVVQPAVMTADSDKPLVPPDFRQAIVDYVAMISLGGAEDDLEGRAFHRDEFERQLARLTNLVNEIESGEGPVQIMISGVHY